jgi:hypothetical protein
MSFFSQSDVRFPDPVKTVFVLGDDPFHPFFHKIESTFPAASRSLPSRIPAAGFVMPR